MKYSNIKKHIFLFIPECFVRYLWHLPLSVFSMFVHGFPSRRLTLIGVVGTKGKTTTSYMTHQSLLMSGYFSAILSTAVFAIGKKEFLNNLKITTPSSWYVQKFLRRAIREGCTHAVI